MQRDPSDSSQLFKQLTTQIVPDINIYIVKSKCFQNSKLQCIWKLTWIRYTFRNREFFKNHLSTTTTTKHTKKSPRSNFYHQALSQSLLSQWILGESYLEMRSPLPFTTFPSKMVYWKVKIIFPLFVLAFHLSILLSMYPLCKNTLNACHNS